MHYKEYLRTRFWHPGRSDAEKDAIISVRLCESNLGCVEFTLCIYRERIKHVKTRSRMGTFHCCWQRCYCFGVKGTGFESKWSGKGIYEH